MDKSISYKKANLFYRTAGEGKPVMLIHGVGEDGNIWNELSDILKENFHVIAPDLPGTGKSGLLEGIDISIDDYAEAIKFILDAESIDNCVMIGHSLGGYITLAFAEKYPERLTGFGLFHSSAFADDEDKIQTRKKSIDFIKQNGAAAFLKTSIPGLFTEDFNKQHFNEIENLIKAGVNLDSKALVQYQEAMISRPDRSNVLKQFSKPVLFISGEKDKAVTLNISLQQSFLPSISYFHLLAFSAHMGMLEEKEKAKNFILRFINGI